MTDMKVALIGLGGIARTVVQHLSELAPGATVSAVLVRADYVEAARAVLDASSDASTTTSINVVDNIDDLLAHDSDVVAECASQAAVAEFGESVLAAGRDLMIASVGALADAALADRLRAMAVENGVQVFAPAGAVGGIDALSAAKTAGLTWVRYPLSQAAECLARFAGRRALRSRRHRRAGRLLHGHGPRGGPGLCQERQRSSHGGSRRARLRENGGRALRRPQHLVERSRCDRGRRRRHLPVRTRRQTVPR